jgi:integrase
MRMKLDAKAVARLKLPDGKNEEIYWDEDLPGFGLRLRASGARTWIAQYRAHGRTPKMKIGSVEKLTEKDARAAARKILAQVELGGDPQGDRKEKRLRATGTLRAVIEDYLADRAGDLRPASLRVARLYLTGSYFRPLHAATLANLTYADITAQLQAIKRGHSENTAGQARLHLSSLLGWAITEGRLGSNPMISARKRKRKPQPGDPEPGKRVLADSELIAIWGACLDDSYGRIIKLLLLTGARRGEVGGLRWSELNFDTGVWKLPAARAKNGRAHEITLPAAALQILEEVPRRSGQDLVFTARGNGFGNWAANKKRLDSRLGQAAAPWTVHDLRRTAATGMIDLGIEPHHVEAVLNHYSGHRSGVAGVYNQSTYAPQIKRALAIWADHVGTLVAGGERKILPMRPAQ